ncbi:Rha family transcriptional regulator, partial [Candidatus Pacearchaeota archaeon]|nr:Rha family transcriptional regulator [Candidatus Pacearchaeota archaeon]
MEDIVKMYSGKPRAGTFLIAEGFMREHGKLVALIEKYRDRFENFSPLPAERIKTKGRPIEQLLLDEDQTMFLGTLLRNTDIVLDFKETLVHQFKRARLVLESLEKHKTDESHQLTRDAGKIVRKNTTDAMQQFVEYSTS